jgi:diadenosine tetraphosphate (Ap4A) HIT family hydrolase
MRLVAGDQECVSCANNARVDLPARERIYLGPRWRAAHAFGTSLPGWLVLVPRHHTVALDDLTADEAADLGPLLRAVSSALRDVVRCRKTYVALFAEAEGFQHIHFHITPASPAWRLTCAVRACSDCSAAIPPAMYLRQQWTR